MIEAKRTRSRMTARTRETILNTWKDKSAGEIGAALGLTRNQVLSTIRQARQAGDVRAVAKPEGTFERKGHRWQEGDPRVLAIASAGALASVRARRLSGLLPAVA